MCAASFFIVTVPAISWWNIRNQMYSMSFLLPLLFTGKAYKLTWNDSVIVVMVSNEEQEPKIEKATTTTTINEILEKKSRKCSTFNNVKMKNVWTNQIRCKVRARYEMMATGSSGSSLVNTHHHRDVSPLPCSIRIKPATIMTTCKLIHITKLPATFLINAILSQKYNASTSCNLPLADRFSFPDVVSRAGGHNLWPHTCNEETLTEKHTEKNVHRKSETSERKSEKKI